MCRAAGFGSLVDLAGSGAEPRDVLAAVPDSLIESVGSVGSATTVKSRLAVYADSGADEVCVVPATADDTVEATLETLAGWRHG
jgi:hypothetical protein